MAIIILLSFLIGMRISAHFSNSEERRSQRGTGSALSHATPSSLNYDVTHNLILSQVRFSASAQLYMSTAGRTGGGRRVVGGRGGGGGWTKQPNTNTFCPDHAAGPVVLPWSDSAGSLNASSCPRAKPSDSRSKQFVMWKLYIVALRPPSHRTLEPGSFLRHPPAASARQVSLTRA